MQRLAGVVLLSLVGILAESFPTLAADTPSLLQMIAEWQYPGSTLSGAQSSDGETIGDSGERTVPSIVCKTIMTTDASVEKVVEYYRTKLSPTPKATAPKEVQARSSGRSVVFSDDSDGRPFALHTVLINTDDTSTTLIISRGKGEAKTHIAWKQYRRFHR